MIRAVEPMTKLVGPSMRAKSAIGAYDGTICVFGGYATFDKEEQTYEDLRSLGDLWVVKMVKGEEALKAFDVASDEKLNKRTYVTMQPMDVLENAKRAAMSDMNIRKKVINLKQKHKDSNVYNSFK